MRNPIEDQIRLNKIANDRWLKSTEKKTSSMIEREKESLSRARTAVDEYRQAKAR